MKDVPHNRIRTLQDSIDKLSKSDLIDNFQLP